jgi:hypothetical protein
MPLGRWALFPFTLSDRRQINDLALIHHFVLRDDVLECMAFVLKAERRTDTRALSDAFHRSSFAGDRGALEGTASQGRAAMPVAV